MHANDGLDAQVPGEAASGPITVRTLGGTSAAFGLSFDRIVSVAASGTPADAAVDSANPGQAIVLEGTGFDASTDVVFLLRNGAGDLSERVVRPTAFDPAGTQLTVTVPLEATTGAVRVVGDRNATSALLADRSDSVAGGLYVGGGGRHDGGRAAARDGVRGRAQQSIPVRRHDDAGRQPVLLRCPDVFGGYLHENDAVNLTLDTTGVYQGAVRVTTNGGTSAAYSVGFTELTSMAASGTPAERASRRPTRARW